MTLTLVLFALAAAAATFTGGYFAIRNRDRQHLILGFSAGMVIGVAFFDLIPEAIEIGGMTHSASTVMMVVAAGFLAYMVLDRAIGLHAHSHDHGHDDGHEHENQRRGVLRASSLSIHSFLDGIGIGLAFQVSIALGAVVAGAVLAHGFSDGINTVTSILKSGGTKQRAFRWLLTNAAAPVAGILITLFFSVSEASLGLILALFAGFFLYMGASDLVPESYHAHPTKWTTAMTVVGAVVIGVIIHIAH